MFERAEQWMREHTLSSFDMTGQFEDGTVLGLQPYENLTNCTAAPYATYLLGKEDMTDGELQDAIDLIRFSEDQFVFWDSPVKRYGVKLYHTPYVAEQYKYMMPVDHSACNVANAWLSLYQRTGDELSLAKAKALIDKKDRKRKRYHNYHCSGHWGDSRLYDLSINSSRLGIEGTVDCLEQYIRARIAK
jgi:maltose/maltodextrin transport system substrate-binding protein